ncbi:MAG: cytochrome c oxidase subunit 3 [Actinomycetota bacterium]
MATAMPLALPPAPAPPRPRVLMVATGLSIAAAAMYFAGLLGTYFALRASAGGTTPDWVPEEASLPLVQGNMALVTILMSAVTMQWAVYAMGRNDRQNSYVALGLTFMFGIAYINSVAFYISQLGVGVADTTYGVLTYGILGSHLVLTITALVFVVLVAFRALGGQFSARDREGLAAAAMVWHFTVLAFVAVVATVVWVK